MHVNVQFSSSGQNFDDKRLDPQITNQHVEILDKHVESENDIDFQRLSPLSEFKMSQASQSDPSFMRG